MIASERRATILLLDGARPDVFDSLVEAGDLPSISRYILEPGGRVPATAVFPSTTGVAYLPFLTGCYPGTCNIPGIRWLDLAQYHGRWIKDRAYVRNYCGPQATLFNADLPSETKSIFDLEHDSVALCTPLNRGLRPERELCRFARVALGGSAHYTTRYELIDRVVGGRLAKIAPRAHRFVFAVFPAVDGVTHSYHPRHRRVLNLYREFDAHLGRYMRCGAFSDDHLVVLVSDHGATEIDIHTDVSLALEDWGLPTLRHPAALWRRNPRVAVMVSGNASAQVYLRPGHRRSRRWGVPEIENGDVDGIPATIVSRLARLPGVGIVAGMDRTDVVVVSRDGRARLSAVNRDMIAYHPESADVLGLGNATRRLTAAEWLLASFDSPYPDSPVQLMQIFRSPRAGDLVLSAAPGCDLRKEWEIPEHKSGHGGLCAEHMQCLVALNKPIQGPLRTVDVYPMVLEHLGYDVPAGIDGVAPRHTCRVP